MNCEIKGIDEKTMARLSEIAKENDMTAEELVEMYKKQMLKDLASYAKTGGENSGEKILNMSKEKMQIQQGGIK